MSAERPAPSSLEDPERLALLEASGLVTATQVEVFDRLARAAARALNAPVAQVNLVTADRQVPGACYGPEPWRSGGPVGLDRSYCQHVVTTSRPLVVDDARVHPLTCSSRATTEAGIRAYAGVPLTVDGHTLGSLCVVDFTPRQWSAQEVELLRDLAGVAVAEIDHRVRAYQQAQQAIRTSQSRYHTLADADPDAILEIDEKSVILSANPAVERIFGYRPDELIGQSLTVLMPEQLRAAHRHGIERYLASGRRNIRWEGIELPALTRSGREIATEVSFGEYSVDGRHVFAGFIRDVTERKRVERLRTAEHRVTRALSESHTLEVAAPRVLEAIGEELGWGVGALWVLDPTTGRLRLMSFWHAVGLQVPKFEAASRQRTFAPGEGLPGRVLAAQSPTWIVDAQADGNFPRARVAAEEGLRSAFCFPLRSGDDFLGVIEFFNHAIQEPDPALLQMAEAIGTDVAQSIRRVQAEEARDHALAELARLNLDLQSANARLQERTAEAEAASQAKSDFMATMSHELRTPLNAVIGYSDLLHAGVPEPISESARRQVQRIGLSARHLLELIDEILTFARVEGGRETLTLAPVRLGELLEELEAVIEPLANEKGLSFRLVVPDPDPVIQTDVGKVRQILLQLLTNAVTFTEAGEVELSAVHAPDAVVYSVRDTGAGIRPEHQARIFEPFWQVEQSTTRSAEGTGMGLAVSQKLAQLLGGEVTVRSTPGVGSLFELRLPLPPPTSQGA